MKNLLWDLINISSALAAPPTNEECKNLLLEALNLNCEDPAASKEQKLKCLLMDEKKLIECSTKNEGTQLAQGDIATDFIPFFINLGLSIAGTMVFIAFLYAGYLLVFANDKEEDIEKGKKILTYAVVGAIMVAISYALVFGVANLDLD